MPALPMCLWLWLRYSFHSLSLWAVLGLTSISFGRAAEPAQRMRAVARATFVLVNIVVSPVFPAHTLSVCGRSLLVRTHGVNQPDVLRRSIAEGRHGAGKAHGQWT